VGRNDCGSSDLEKERKKLPRRLTECDDVANLQFEILRKMLFPKGKAVLIHRLRTLFRIRFHFFDASMRTLSLHSSRASSLVSALSVLAVVVLAGAFCQSASAQRVITDPYGTEYLIDALPPAMQRDVMLTQESFELGGNSEGPLKVDGLGRIYLTENESAGLSRDTLVDSLRGIVLVSRPGDVRADGWPGVEGIWQEFDEFPPAVAEVMNRYIGQPVSLASLDSMLKDAIRAYRGGGRPVVDISLPEQDITSGVVQLVVVEGRLGRIRVEGVDAEAEEYLRGHMHLQKGDLLDSKKILHDLNWLNKSPYRKVDLIYAPGYNFGETDLILRALETNSTFFYLGYEDSGTDLLGNDRLIFGAYWGDAFGPDQSLSYQLTTDFEFDRVRGHSVVYTGPNRLRHYVTLLASYVDMNTTIPVANTGLAVAGEDYQFSGRYAIPLSWAPLGQNHEMQFGFDFKSSNNNLEFGGDAVFDTTTQIYQISAGYNILAQDSTGLTKIDITGYLSPGGLSSSNDDESFAQARSGAESGYLYGIIRAERQQRLPEGFSLRLKGALQGSNGNLLASEQLGGGGYDSIRGFDQRIIRGDQGLVTTVELYTPATSIGQYMRWKNETDELRMLAFLDYGNLSSKDRLEGEPNSFEMMSVGVGLRWRYSDWFRLRLDYGLPVNTSGLDGIDDNGRVHIGATANF
jgi:hemolysin activation/secretion protein